MTTEEIEKLIGRATGSPPQKENLMSYVMPEC